jgi:hypothetical protein
VFSRCFDFALVELRESVVLEKFGWDDLHIGNVRCSFARRCSVGYAYIRSCSSIFITYLLFQMISQRVFIERQPSQIISFLCTFGTVFYVGKLATQNLRESSSTK